MSSKIQIYKQGLEEYPKTTIVLGNFMMILWIALGTVACWFLYTLAAWIFLIFAIIMVGIMLRKSLCTNCYYYNKWCCLGWGKLSALFFKRGDIEKFNVSVGQKLAPLTYSILSVIPIVFIVTSIVQELSITKVTVLILLLLISFYSGTISRKKTCAECKMRLTCRGCAVK